MCSGCTCPKCDYGNFPVLINFEDLQPGVAHFLVPFSHLNSKVYPASTHQTKKLQNGCTILELSQPLYIKKNIRYISSLQPGNPVHYNQQTAKIKVEVDVDTSR